MPCYYCCSAEARAEAEARDRWCNRTRHRHTITAYFLWYLLQFDVITQIFYSQFYIRTLTFNIVPINLIICSAQTFGLLKDCMLIAQNFALFFKL